MAAEKVEIVLDGKDAGLVRAWLAGRDSVAAYEAGLKKLEPVTRENAKAAADFERAAKQAFEATRTPQEKFTREQEKLQDLFQTGLIDVQTYNRALQQQKQILEQSDAALQSRLQSERQQAALAARVIETLITPQERYAKKLEELNALQAAGQLTADQYARAVAREKQALDAADESLQKAAAEHKRLGADARAVFDAVRTPLERYNQRLAELDQHLKEGRIDQESYNRAIAKEKILLDQSDESLQQQKRDREQLGASAKRVIESILTPQEKYAGKMADLNRLLAAGALNQQQFNRAAAQAKIELDSAGKAGDTAGTAVRNFVSRFAGVAGVVSGLTAIAGQLRREYDNLVDRQKSAGDKQVDVATAEKEALRNLGKDASLTPEQYGEFVKKTVLETGASAGAVHGAAGGAFSFKGDLPAAQAAEAVRIAAELNPEDQAAMEANSRAIINLMIRDKNLKAKDIAGFFIAAKQASPTVKDSQFAENIAPGIGQGLAFGETPREAAALRATIGTGIGDEEGRITATAAIQLEKQLAQFLPKVEGGTIGRLKFLQTPAGRSLQKKLLGSLDEQAKASGVEKGDLTAEAKSFTTLVDLIKGGTGMSSLLDANLQKIPEVAGAGKIFDESQEEINKSPLQQAARQKRAYASAAELLQLTDIKGGEAGIAREGLQKAFKAAGTTQIEQRVAAGSFELITNGGDQKAAETAIGSLEALAADREKTREYYSPTGTRSVTAPSERDLEVAGLLRDIAGLLRDIKAKPPVKVIPKDNRQPPAPVPAAALGGPQ